MKVTTTIQSIVYLHQNGNLSFQKHKHLQINQPLLQYPVSWSCKKVGDVKNCFEDDWKWNDSDISKELPVGVEISATAVYNGADAGNI